MIKKRCGDPGCHWVFCNMLFEIKIQKQLFFALVRYERNMVGNHSKPSQTRLLFPQAHCSGILGIIFPAPFKTDFKKDLFTETASPDISVSLRIIYPIVLLHFLNYGHFNIFSDLIFFFFFFPKPCSSAPSWIYLFLEMFHTYQAEGNLLSFHSCENRL